MSLGAGETNLLSITNAYGMIVNGGKKIKPTLLIVFKTEEVLLFLDMMKENVKIVMVTNLML